MYHPNRILERELEFTKIYRENIGQPKAVRESRCMDAQMATYFVTIQPQDLIAGRISRPYVVFAQCMEGDGIDKTGYCIDVANCEKELKRMKADDSYSREDCMQAEEMIQFWKTENTNTKIRQQFPKSWAVFWVFMTQRMVWPAPLRSQAYTPSSRLSLATHSKQRGSYSPA